MHGLGGLENACHESGQGTALFEIDSTLRSTTPTADIAVSLCIYIYKPLVISEANAKCVPHGKHKRRFRDLFQYWPQAPLLRTSPVGRPVIFWSSPKSFLPPVELRQETGVSVRCTVSSLPRRRKQPMYSRYGGPFSGF